MICISVAPESRKLAKVDLFNAAGQGDLIELCLDNLVKEPDVGDMLSDVSKPVIVSCRRKQDGGRFQGTEEERQALLRQAIVAGPAYIELDFEIAGKIPRFGKTKRVISYTSLDKPLGNVDEILERAAKLHADVVKFTWPTPTLQSAWPLLAAATAKREIPVVGVGWGESSVTFSLLARRYGSPWIYAALEKGMEAHPGQPTVNDLDELYSFRNIGSGTRFVGVMGSGTSGQGAIRVWNRAFQSQGIDRRCLPMHLEGFGGLAQMLEVLRINALLVDDDRAEQMLPFAEQKDPSTAESAFVDTLLKQQDGWTAYNRLARSTVKRIEKKLGAAEGANALERRNVLILGSDGVARSIASGVRGGKGIVSISAPDDKRSKFIAETFGLRHVPFASIYETLADVVILADSRLKVGHHKTELNASFLRPNMLLVDVSRLPEESEFLRQARERGASVVDPREIFADRTAWQFKTVTGSNLPEEALKQGLTNDT